MSEACVATSIITVLVGMAYTVVGMAVFTNNKHAHTKKEDQAAYTCLVIFVAATWPLWFALLGVGYGFSTVILGRNYEYKEPPK